MKYKYQIEVLTWIIIKFKNIVETNNKILGYENLDTDEVIELNDEIKKAKDQIQKTKEAIDYLEKTDVLDVYLRDQAILFVPRNVALKNAHKIMDFISGLRHSSD